MEPCGHYGTPGRDKMRGLRVSEIIEDPKSAKSYRELLEQEAELPLQTQRQLEELKAIQRIKMNARTQRG